MTKMSEQALRELLRSNPDLRASEPVEERRGKTEAHKQLERAERGRLENRFIDLWALANGAPLEQQYKFHPARRFRADFCHVPTKTIVEIDGGTWTGGAHNRGSTYIYQQERDREARRLGYEVKRLTTNFNADDIEAIKRLIEERAVDNA